MKIKSNEELISVARVCLLGKFNIQYQHKIITADDIASKMVLKLAAYLLFYHDKKVTFDELINYLWENKEIKNERGALKNLMYRLREVFRQVFGEAPFWITDQEGYHWNGEIGIVTDVEEFDKIAEQDVENLSEESLQTAYDIYREKFAVECDDTYWAMYMQIHYQNKYYAIMEQYCKLLEARGAYDKIIEIAQRGLQIENKDDLFYYWHIYVLIKQQNFEQAEKLYNMAIGRMYDFKEDEYSSRMRYLSNMLQTKGSVENLSVQRFVEDIQEQYKDAKIIKPYHDMLSTVLHVTIAKQSAETQAQKYKRKLFLDCLGEAMCASIRISDTIIKCSAEEYFIILLNCDLQNSEVFIQRMLQTLNSRSGAQHEFKLEIDKTLIYGNGV